MDNVTSVLVSLQRTQEILVRRQEELHQELCDKMEAGQRYLIERMDAIEQRSI